MNRAGCSFRAALVAIPALLASCSAPAPDRPATTPPPRPSPPPPSPPAAADPSNERLAHVEITAVRLRPSAAGPGSDRLDALAAAADSASGRLDVLAADEARALLVWMCAAGAAAPLHAPSLLLSPRVRASVTTADGSLSLSLLASPRAGGSRLHAQASSPRVESVTRESDLGAFESLLLTLARSPDGGRVVVVLRLVGGG